MSARKYLNETGLASLWAKIVNKINALGDQLHAEWDASVQTLTMMIATKVDKSGDIVNGTLTALNLSVSGGELRLKPNASSSNDSGDIVFYYGNGQEKARLYVNDNPTTVSDSRLNFRTYKSDGTALTSQKIPLASDIPDISTKVSKSGDTMSGRLTVKGDAGGSWVSSKDPDQAAIRVDGGATNGQRYDTIISNKCYNGNVITIGRITNQLCFGYVESGQSSNNLYKFMNFEPANDTGRVTFGTSGATKSYINLDNGGFYGNWNGVTDDHNTNNTTDTWVPVYSNNKMQHRVLSAQLNTYISADGTNCISANNCNIQFIKCVRIGQMVTCTFHLAHSSGQTGGVAYVALKSDFRPSRQIFFPVSIVGNANAYANESAHRMYLYTDGTLKLNIDNTNATVQQVFGSVSYCIN